jgi:polygalacturonase
MYRSGGHGLSIGPVGGKDNNTVVDITFSDSVVESSQNGCRIKTNSGTTGQVNLYQTFPFIEAHLLTG